MKVQCITVRNYRMLHDVAVNLEDDITLIVGKNNSGKTSFFEIIKMLLSDESSLSFEDFSQECYGEFRLAEIQYHEYLSKSNDEEKEEALSKLQELIPKIELHIRFEYDKDTDSLVDLSEFITDLDPNRNDACVCISFEPFNSLGLFKTHADLKSESPGLLLYLKDSIGKFFKTSCYALDTPTGYKREIDGNFKNSIRRIVSFEEIKALRVLDDKKGDRNNTLALGFANYYHQRDKTTEDVENLEASLKVIGSTLKDKYKDILASILEDLSKFGAETTVSIPEIVIDSVFDSESIIKNNIRYLYKQDEIDLPESYNGLGYSNLIYMILEFASFIEKQTNSKEDRISQFLVVMIEEPEAHMHPQMQQVFISQVKQLLSKAKFKGIYTQLIITSHSSHIISEAGIDLNKGFNRIRYFVKLSNRVMAKDFNDLAVGDDKKTFRFLKQYLNLHKSDLFFADKVIMVEGVTERLLMPQMIGKVAPRLLNEYITILEVGGAYTHKFKEILEFIGVKTLMITDLDSYNPLEKKAWPVDLSIEHLETTNQTLQQWLPKKKLIIELLACKEVDKVHNGLVRVAFQICETGECYYSRSFEEAFIEKNKVLIRSQITDEAKGITRAVKNEFSRFKSQLSETIATSSSYLLAPSSSKGKTNFAFDIMSFDEDRYGIWQVPLYIQEGLEWLEKASDLTKTPVE